jgi:hypothetical protein
MDHLEDVLSNKPIEVVSGHAIVEIKPQGVTKGRVVERILSDVNAATEAGAAASEFILCIGETLPALPCPAPPRLPPPLLFPLTTDHQTSSALVAGHSSGVALAAGALDLIRYCALPPSARSWCWC